MMSLREIIEGAERRGIAIGHFNVANLEQLKAVAHAGMRLQVPVIVGVSEGEGQYLGLNHFRDLVASYNAEHAAPSAGGRGFRLFLNADHVHSLEHVREAARVGFHAILFDPLGEAQSRGRDLSFDDHVTQTRAAVKLAKEINRDVLVEGELGYLGSASEVFEKMPAGVAVRKEDLTKPEDAARFVKETGVDLLAPAVGNVHGIVGKMGNPPLHIPRIRSIREALRQARGKPVPLVLHGGSGISDADFIAAIDAGVSVIHISTELRAAWRVGLEHSLKAHPKEVAPYKLMPEVLAAMEGVVMRRLRLFGKL
ncbi:MAG: class II fructose-bisphosphate aldolase [Candidatus Brennerbacteria bacterium]